MLSYKWLTATLVFIDWYVWTAPLPEYTGSGSYSTCDEEGYVRALLATRLLLGSTTGKWREYAAGWCVMVGTKQSERAFGRARSGCVERLAGVFASRADASEFLCLLYNDLSNFS